MANDDSFILCALNFRLAQFCLNYWISESQNTRAGKQSFTNID